MKIAIIAAFIGLSAVDVAAASEKITDLDYIRATRCKGLALGSGATDTAALDAYLKVASQGRFQMAQQRADQEFDRAKRDAKRSGGKERYAAELNGACTAFTGAPQDTASRTTPRG